MKLLFLAMCLGVLFAGVHAGRTLVLLDDLALKTSHSIFFQTLVDNGHELNFRTLDAEVSLTEYDEYVYDSLVIFAPLAEDVPKGVRSEDILAFVDAGHDVLVAADLGLSFYMNEIAGGCGARFDGDSTSVIDHFNFDVSDRDGDHTLIAATNFRDTGVVAGLDIAPVLYRGVGMRLVEGNGLVFPILSGFATSYSHDTEEPIDWLHAAAGNLALVAGLQARNNARVALTGSLEMFSDDFITSQVLRPGEEAVTSGNRVFVTALAQWTFGQRGVLRLKSVSHHRVGEDGQQHGTYSVKENLQYNVEVEEWNGEEWVGYEADDLQVDIQMLDPYIRQNLENLGGGKYVARFVAPDTYGVYSFKLTYAHRGYTMLLSNEPVTIRPLRHDEYERFIVCAYPYYVGAFSMMAGVALYVVIFMFSKP